MASLADYMSTIAGAPVSFTKAAAIGIFAVDNRVLLLELDGVLVQIRYLFWKNTTKSNKSFCLRQVAQIKLSLRSCQGVLFGSQAYLGQASLIQDFTTVMGWLLAVHTKL